MKKVANIVSLFTLVLLAFLAGVQEAMAEDVDFDNIFSRLESNRRVYNRYNVAVKRPTERDMWMNLFLERSDINTAMYKENEYLIGLVTDVFKAGKVSDSIYDALADCVIEMEDNRSGDPFLVEEFMKILIPHYLSRPSGDVERKARLYHFYASTQHEIALLQCDDAKACSNEFYRRTIALADSLPPEKMWPVVKSLTEMAEIVWTRRGYNTLAEARSCVTRLSRLINKVKVVAALDPATLSAARKAVANFDRRLIHEGFLIDSSIMPHAEADSMIDEHITEYETMENPELKTFCIKNQLELYKGYITADSALTATMKFYREKVRIPEVVSAEDMNRLQIPLFDLIYFNSLSDIPDSRKYDNVLFLCDEIIKLFSAIDDNQTDNSFVPVLIKFVTYPHLIKYLTLEDKLRFMAELMVKTQVATVAHSAHVAALATRIVDGVSHYRPDLLPVGIDPGQGGWHEFIRRAAIYHDLVKMSIVSVVTNEFRPLTAHEREMIRRHPSLGVDFLGIDEDLLKFHDTTLGHHKWFDGNGGYPSTYDNTASDVRVMTDILTIADCLEAATDMIGRNYSPVKHFRSTIDEMSQQDGTRYNPEILDLIRNNPDVFDELASIVDNDWMYIYYDIYETYFNPDDSTGVVNKLRRDKL